MGGGELSSSSVISLEPGQSKRKTNMRFTKHTQKGERARLQECISLKAGRFLCEIKCFCMKRWVSNQSKRRRVKQDEICAEPQTDMEREGC